MSIIFKPKISGNYDALKTEKPTVVRAIKRAFSFGSGRMAPVVKTVPREASSWSASDLQKMINLRAIGVTYKECSHYFNRSANSCAGGVDTNNLYGAIKLRREELKKEALK